jgi:hypothetical protein
MCYFVFVGVSERHPAMLVEYLTKAGFGVVTTTNTGVRSSFPEGDAISGVLCGGCSCDIYAEHQSFDEAIERARYRKKNWSTAKIERVIREKRSRERATVAVFRDAFASLVRTSGDARVLAHCFSGNVDTEELRVSSRRSLTLEEYLEAGGTYDLDIVHDVRIG